MAKPIFLVQVTYQMTQERVIALQEKLSQQIPDWHILVAALKGEGASPEFSAHHVGNATDIEIEELKALVLKEFQR